MTYVGIGIVLLAFVAFTAFVINDVRLLQRDLREKGIVRD